MAAGSYAPPGGARPLSRFVSIVTSLQGLETNRETVDTVYILVDSVYMGEATVERTRERLVRAARAHLDERGLDGLSLRAIARRAGVSHGAPLRHFAGVDHLLAAAAAEGFRELHAHVDAAVREAGDPSRDRPTDRLARAARGYARFATANPGVFELMFRHERQAAQDPELLEAGAAAFGQLVGLVSDAQEAGWWPDELPGEVAAVVWATVHGVVSLWIPGTLSGAVSLTGIDADLDRIIDLATRGVLETGWTGRTPRRRTST
jgi:AcrR family transcriptional regulator